MPNQLNRTGLSHARKLVRDGKVERNRSWNFSTADSNKLLGDPPNWSEYRKWFLGRRPGADEQTKNAWLYPHGKNGKVWRSAVIAIRQRSSQQGDTEIFEAAGRLLKEIDKDQQSMTMPENAEPLWGPPIDLFDILQQDQNAEDIPEDLLLIPLGEIELIDGRPSFIMDELSGQMVIANFSQRTIDMVIDYDHRSLFMASSSKAAGWVREMAFIGDGDEAGRLAGLWINVSWTENAREKLAAREYRYFSPVIARDPNSKRITSIFNIGLLNVPNMHLAEPITDVLSAGFSPPMIQPQSIETEEQQKMKELLQKLSTIFGLGEDADEEKVIAAAQSAHEIASTAGEALGLAGEALTAEGITGSVLALKDDSNTVTREEHQILVDKLARDDAQGKVDGALAAGKLTPAQTEWALAYAAKDPKGFEAFLEQQGQVAPTTGKTTPPPPPPSGDAVVLDDSPEAQSVRDMLGVTAEDVQKYYRPSTTASSQGA